MNKYSIILAFVFAFQVLTVKAQQDTLKLKNCIQFTLNNHPNSTIYQNKVRLAAEKLRERKAAFLPTLDGNVTLDYNMKLQTMVVPPGAFGPEETKIQLGNKLVSGAYAEANQTLFNTSTAIAIRNAKAEVMIADLTLLKENERLIYNTAVAYYEVFTYQEKGRLLKENEKQYIDLVSILKLRFEQGVVKRSEYDRARVNLNNTFSDIAVNDNKYDLALNKLKNAMGMSLDVPLAIDNSFEYGSIPQIPELADFAGAGFLDSRIDSANFRLKELALAGKKAAYLPSLSVYGKYGANAYGQEFTNAFDQWFDYSVIGLKLTIPLFDLKRNSQYRQSRIELDNERLTQKLNADKYRLDLKNSGSQMLSSWTSLSKNKENLDLARSVLDAAKLAYREGASTLSDFLADEYTFKEAQSNYLTSILDFLTQRLSYERSKGNLVSYINALK